VTTLQRFAPLLAAVLVFGTCMGPSGPVHAADAPVDHAEIQRQADALVKQLLDAQAAMKGTRKPESIQLDGLSWQSDDGPAGTSAFAVEVNDALKRAFAARGITATTGSAVGSKGIGGALLRGGFQALKGGFKLSLSMVDANTGHMISEARSMMSTASLAGLAQDQLLPPDATNARELAKLVREGLGAGPSAFGLKISTDRGTNGAYFEGEALHLDVQADRDCYLRLYHISWSDHTLTLIFPNRGDTDALLRTGSVMRFPTAGSAATFEVSKPDGVDAIIAVASETPFEDDAWVQAQVRADANAPVSPPPPANYDPAPTASSPPASASGDGYTSWPPPDSASTMQSRGVVRAGDYLAAPGISAERAKGIMAKGLLVRVNGGAVSAPAATGNYNPNAGGTTDPSYPQSAPTLPVISPPALQAPSTGHSLARAACFYTTLPRLHLRR
jgi:hypothetical protein